METMAGGELFDRIVAKSFYYEKEARGVCKILLESIAYCHHARVVSLEHNDLLLVKNLNSFTYIPWCYVLVLCRHTEI